MLWSTEEAAASCQRELDASVSAEPMTQTPRHLSQGAS